MIPIIEHAAWEEKMYNGTWADELRDGDALISGSLEFVAPPGLNVGTTGATAPTVDSPLVGWWLLRDSTVGKYQLKLRALTEFGERLESDVIVVVLA